MWWDVTLRSGEAYDPVTEQALREAGAVVVLWSPRSVVSRWVRAEATLADRNRTLVRRGSTCDLPIMFELTQTADLRVGTGDAGIRRGGTFFTDVRRCVGADKAKPGDSAHGLRHIGPRPRAGAGASVAVLPLHQSFRRSRGRCFRRRYGRGCTVALSAQRTDERSPQSATAGYRHGAARDLRQIGPRSGRTLSCSKAICSRASNDLRVTAQLVEAETGNIVWTQRFDRPPGRMLSAIAGGTLSARSPLIWPCRSSAPNSSMRSRSRRTPAPGSR